MALNGANEVDDDVFEAQHPFISPKDMKFVLKRCNGDIRRY